MNNLKNHMRTPHTAAFKGKRIFVITKSGEKFVDKFMDRDSRHVYFENRVIERDKIRVFSIYRAKPQ